jgi:transaldolase
MAENHPELPDSNFMPSMPLTCVEEKVRGAIKSKLAEGKSGEKLFFELALEDLTQAADLFRPVHDRTCGVDGWVSLEVSPLLAHDTKSTIAVAKDLHARAGRPNLLIKIPGTPEGLPAIEEAIFGGVPVNVTLLFSDDQYVAAADAFMRGIERRIEAGLPPNIGSVASVFISRWDVAVAGKVPETLNNQLGIAVAKRTYKAYLDQLSSPRWMRAYNAGARPQRLLWASTGTKDPKASATLYITALAAPFTVNTMPEGTLKALAARCPMRSRMALILGRASGAPFIARNSIDSGRRSQTSGRYSADTSAPNTKTARQSYLPSSQAAMRPPSTPPIG